MSDGVVISVVATFIIAAVFFVIQGWQLKRETRRLASCSTAS